MRENRPEPDRVSGAVSPDSAEDLAPASRRRVHQSADPSFADRLELGELPNSSMLRYPGPHDYCGFEIADPEPVQESRFEGLLNLSMFPASGGAADRTLRPDQDRRGRGGSAGVDAERPAPGDRCAWGDTALWSGTGEPESRPPAAASRQKLPVVPGYEVLGELGRGGMGVVYKARQLRLNRVIALKMILAGAYAGPDAVERFMAEAEIFARLEHPNIVRIHAIGDFEQRPYVELEYVEGGSLESRLVGTPWPPREAARLVEDLARGVSEAHRMGIVHRDLKPANILMTDDGTPKITDFGLAKSIEEDSGLTRTQSIIGSPNYMAPEQAEGRAKEIGPAADLYALGASLYELLTGRPPFLGPTVLSTLELVKNADPVSPRHLQPGVTTDLETICLKCLKKVPRERYESADALAEDLRRYLDGEPIRARPTPHWERAWKWVRRRPAFAALVVVSALSFLAAAGGGLWYRADRVRQRSALLRRVEGVRTQVDQFVLLGEEAIRREDWDGARAHLSSALAVIRNEPRLAAMREAVFGLLAMCDRQIDERTGRATSRARLSAFQGAYDEAVFYQTQYTGLDPASNVRASRAAARRALDHFHPMDDAGLAVDRDHFDAAEIAEITARYYELALILAEAVSRPLQGEDPAAQAREALRILRRIERVRPPTKTFYLRRAAYLEQAGDRPGAEAQRTRAGMADVAENASIDDFLEGEAAYHQRDYRQAVAAFRRVLGRQPDHFWAQYLLAICHLKERRAPEAQALLTGCQGRRPAFVWTYLLKGFAEGEMDEFDLAEADFQRATELGLDDAARYVMLVNRGVMRIRRGRHAAAADDFLAAIASKPDQFQAYVDLAHAYQNLERFDDALGALDRAIARSPAQAVLYRTRAQIHRLQSHGPEALEDLERAIARAAPEDPVVVGDHLERALILEQSGRNAEALAECDRALALRPGRCDVHRVRGAILVKLKRYDEAIRSFDICFARGTPSPSLYEARALALAYRGSYDRAIADYSLAIATGHGTASLHAHRGWAYLFGGAPAPAARDFGEALRLNPGDGGALNGRALANVQLHKVSEAVADARAATQANPHDSRLLYGAARVYCQAAAHLEAESGRSHGAWDTARRYRLEALSLIVRAMGWMPAPERSTFWSQVVRTDAVLDPIRKSTKFRDLDVQFVRPIDRKSPGGVSPR
ncbi:MAG: protein kinase domain-containing protein [Isosphaeraceae bacterium]